MNLHRIYTFFKFRILKAIRNIYVTYKIVNVKSHPARFSQKIPEFFINLLTDHGDIVLDLSEKRRVMKSTDAVLRNYRHSYYLFLVPKAFSQTLILSVFKLAIRNGCEPAQVLPQFENMSIQHLICIFPLNA